MGIVGVMSVCNVTSLNMLLARRTSLYDLQKENMIILFFPQVLIFLSSNN